MEQLKADKDNDITLKDVTSKIRGYIGDAFRFWYIIGFFVLLTAGYQLVKYFTFVPVYPATITFSVDEDEGGGVSGLSSVLGQFGLGGVRPTRYNLDKILELSKSRRVVQKTLFDSITIDNHADLLINHLMKIYALNIDAKKQEFYFKHDSLTDFDLAENEKMISVYNFIIGPPNNPKKALLAAGYNEDTNIMSLTATTKDETLSYEMARKMFESLSNYYITKAIEKQVKTYRIVREKRDSVLTVLKSVEYQLANFRDTHKSLMMRTDQVTELRLQRELTALAAMYAEVLKNTEVADFALRNKTPFIQVIDAPLLPLAPAQLSLIRQLFIGVALGLILGFVFIVLRTFYRDNLAS